MIIIGVDKACGAFVILQWLAGIGPAEDALAQIVNRCGALLF